jgi:hypothetical protein
LDGIDYEVISYAEGTTNGADPTPPSLESIFGKGKGQRLRRTLAGGIALCLDLIVFTMWTGKHAREKRRKKENKYKQHSRVREDMDPLDELLLKAERANNPEKFRQEELEARRLEQR